MFNNIAAAPPVEVFKLSADYQADPNPNKVSLGAGAYRDEHGKPWILPVVKKAELQLAKDIDEEKINHEYLPVLGYGTYSEAATQLILGIYYCKANPAGKGRAFRSMGKCYPVPILVIFQIRGSLTIDISFVINITYRFGKQCHKGRGCLWYPMLVRYRSTSCGC